MIKEKLNRYVEILDKIPEHQNKYAWLMLLGKKSMKLVDDLKLDKFEVPGCQTRTWLIPGWDARPTIHFSADSDALISKGMVCMLADIFSGSTPKEILAFERKDLEDLKLDVLLTPGRRNGVYGMLQKIREYALESN
tara:strand:- start:89 stop:499 length:411 start_codon:yes stop_codon:yes gene_type:complete